MPIEFEIFPEERRTRTRCHGLVKGMDLLEYYRALRSHPLFDPTYDEIVDLTEVDDIDVTPAHLRALSQTVLPNQKQGHPMRIAVIAPDDLEFGMSRMYQALRSESENDLRVFRTRDAAEEWMASGTD